MTHWLIVGQVLSPLIQLIDSFILEESQPTPTPTLVLLSDG